MNTGIIIVSPLPPPSRQVHEDGDHLDNIPWWNVRAPFLLVLAALVTLLVAILSSPEVMDSTAHLISGVLR